MASPLIRPALPEDLEAILQIEDQSFARPNWNAGAFAQYPATVAALNGQVVGVLVTREIYAGTNASLPEIEILNLAVAPGFRRLGIASLLLQPLFVRPAAFFLEVRESNQVAQALYRKFGFQVIGRRPAYYENPIESALVMKMKKC